MLENNGKQEQKAGIGRRNIGKGMYREKRKIIMKEKGIVQYMICEQDSHNDSVSFCLFKPRLCLLM